MLAVSYLLVACAFVHIFFRNEVFKESDNKFGGSIIYCLFYFIALEDREEINQVWNKEIWLAKSQQMQGFSSQGNTKTKKIH